MTSNGQELANLQIIAAGTSRTHFSILFPTFLKRQIIVSVLVARGGGKKTKTKTNSNKKKTQTNQNQTKKTQQNQPRVAIK